MSYGSVIARYMRYAEPGPNREQDDENALVASARGGEPGASDRLLRRHIGLVIRIAMEYRGRGVPLDDMIHEACLGLLKAVHRFDPGNGARFMTYAGFWVRKAILNALADQSRTIRIPRYQREHGHVLPKEVRLDEAIRPGEGRTLGEGLADPRTPLPGAVLFDRERLTRLRHHLRLLPARDRAVLASRYGLHGEPAMTLMEVGARLGVSRERVRQIEQAALNRLQWAMR